MLPEEIIYIILCHYSIDFIEPTICSYIYKNKKKYLNKYSSNIAKWYRYNRFQFNYMEEYIHILSKKKVIRFYILHYPKEYLMQYPEFVVNKCNLSSYLLKDLKSIDERKKSDVLSFLKQSEITKHCIFYSGW